MGADTTAIKKRRNKSNEHTVVFYCQKKIPKKSMFKKSMFKKSIF